MPESILYRTEQAQSFLDALLIIVFNIILYSPLKFTITVVGFAIIDFLFK